MASTSLPHASISTKETTNYARLCRLLVDVGCSALRNTFDSIHPPADLHKTLLSPPVHVILQSLYTGKRKVLNPTQWARLYPAHGSVSSAGFDITLLTVLLRNICGLITPAAGWDNLPAASDKSIEDDIARVKYYRNNLYGHASQASIDDASFSVYWQEIREAMVRLGGANFGVIIDNLKIDCMDPDTEEHYTKLLAQWKKDDDSIKDKLQEMEDNIAVKLEQMRCDLQDNIRGTMQQMQEIKDILTAKADENKDENKIRGGIQTMKTGMGNISEKVDSFSVENTRDNLEQMKSELENMKDELHTLRKAREEAKNDGISDPAEIINVIRQLYKSREGCLAPFPWCEEFHFNINDIFTKLEMVKKKKSRGASTTHIVEISSIFQPHEECPKPRTVLIEGDPGIGKTTYCHKLAYDWAISEKDRGDYLATFEVVLLLKCRDIESNLWEALDDQLLPRDITEEEREKFFNYVRHNQSRVLLVLDGLDELPANMLPAFSEIIQGRMLPRCHLVVTARQETGITIKRFCDTLLEIKGFTQEDAQNFVIKYFKSMKGLAQKLLHKLKNDKSLKDLVSNPLNLSLLCLLCEDFEGFFPESRTELFLEIVLCVLRRYRKKKGLPENSEDLIEVYHSQLKHLGSIALDCLREDSMYFEKKKLENHASDSPGFGFLSVQPGSSKRRPCLRYSFLHKSFQEVFAAFYLCCQLLCNEISPESLVADTRYFHELRQVLLFTCGMLAPQSKVKTVGLIKSIATQVKGESSDNFYLALKCIKECKREKSDVHVESARVFGSFLSLKSGVFTLEILDDASVAALSEALKVNSTLVDLSFTIKGISDAVALAEMLKTNTSLTKLRLYGAACDTGIAALAEALHTNGTLKEVILCDPDIGATGASALAEALKTNTTLKRLHFIFGSARLGTAVAVAIAEGLKTNNTLEELNFRGYNIGTSGVSALAEALKVNSTLTKLLLPDNNIGTAAATALAEALKSNTGLMQLYLYNNNISCAGAAALAEALKVNTTLKTLNLSNNDIGAGGATVFAEALKTNTGLTDLCLYHNNISTAGAIALAEGLKMNTTLTELNLYDNDISAAGTVALAEVRTTNTILKMLCFS